MDLQLFHQHSVQIRALTRRIDETFAQRTLSARHWEDWQQACEALHAQYDALDFPDEAFGALKRGEADGIAAALAYLEADPWHFRSGYCKEALWHTLKRIVLCPDELNRLEQLALRCLHRRIRREFWPMARFLRLRATPKFWSEIRQLADATIRTPEAIKSSWLLLACANQPVRRWIRRQSLRRVSHDLSALDCARGVSLG